jgi:hypothetical protein
MGRKKIGSVIHGAPSVDDRSEYPVGRVLDSKLCQTLMDFDGIETHPICQKTLTDFNGN